MPRLAAQSQQAAEAQGQLTHLPSRPYQTVLPPSSVGGAAGVVWLPTKNRCSMLRLGRELPAAAVRGAPANVTVAVRLLGLKAPPKPRQAAAPPSLPH